MNVKWSRDTDFAITASAGSIVGAVVRRHDRDSNVMEFIDLKTQYRSIKHSVDRRIAGVLEHGRYIMGPEVSELETRLAEFVGVDHAVGVASGTDALLMAMMALEIGQGHEIITTPFSFIATAEAIALTGAKPVFVDIDPRTFNIDPSLVEAAITSNTRAIMPVSLYGQCALFDAINAIAKRYNLPVIEDGAQSFGATYKHRRSCGLTTIGCTSFYPSKPLGCYGDGGACFTNHAGLAERMRQIRVHGETERYKHAVLGINGRIDTLQAAILLAKLETYETELQARERIGARYTAGFQTAKSLVTTPYIEPHSQSTYAQYTIQVRQRDIVRKCLSSAGVPTAIHYPIPLHMQPVFRDTGAVEGDHPIAERAAEHVISLPMHPYLAPSEQDKIVSVTIDAVGSSCLG